jgi:voltage-gated potassium channel Kch
MFFAFVFSAIGTIGDKPFFAQQGTATTADYLYFSFVTLTTVGYGDLSARGGLGRATAVIDALLGQIYLVTVIALLVSQLGRRRPSARDD